MLTNDLEMPKGVYILTITVHKYYIYIFIFIL